uniref:EF-hand domain-containing family member C2 n=1 Tax=Lygus hesperus TaxID=30085 RepID=A0A0A9WVS8_LYGHE
MRLDNDKYEDAIRRFVLAVYPIDDTIAIFEPVIRNSGIVGGKFLQKQRVNTEDSKINSNISKGKSKFYTANDFYVGAHVVINSFPFVLLSSDEHSLRYMEHNA